MLIFVRETLKTYLGLYAITCCGSFLLHLHYLFCFCLILKQSSDFLFYLCVHQYIFLSKNNLDIFLYNQISPIVQNIYFSDRFFQVGSTLSSWFLCCLPLFVSFYLLLHTVDLLKTPDQLLFNIFLHSKFALLFIL